MTPHCSVSLRIPMAQGRYLDVFLLSGFLFESITQGFQYLTVQAGPTNKPGIIVYVRDFHGYPSLRAAYARLTRALRKKTLPFQWRKDWKKNMPFILLLSSIEIAFIHIRLTQLTRKHTPQFCLRILTRLKVLLTQPFDMSNPFCKQSTGVLNAAHLEWPRLKNTKNLPKRASDMWCFYRFLDRHFYDIHSGYSWNKFSDVAFYHWPLTFLYNEDIQHGTCQKPIPKEK